MIEPDKTNNLDIQQAFMKALSESECVDIIASYFYFTGFKDLASQLKDKHIRILINKQIDPEVVIAMVDYIKAGNDDSLNRWRPRQTVHSVKQIQQNYINTLIGIANDSELLEDPKAEQAFDIFIEKVSNGTLEIRKTSTEHSEAVYLFAKKQSGSKPLYTDAFTGKSIITYNGLLNSIKLQQHLKSKREITATGKTFLNLWQPPQSDVIINPYNKEFFIDQTKARIGKYCQPTPYEMYIRVLHELFSYNNEQKIKSPKNITRGDFMDLQYQVDAVQEGLNRLKRFDGVIVADVVGLGKSVIAACIAYNLRLKTVIIAPPHLVDQWEDYKEQFHITGSRVFSSGKIDDVFERYQYSKEPLLLIIDEAHRYRNEETNNYKMLHQVCRGHINNKVLLLTATPFNNSPQDIFALIRLFQTPGKATIRSVDNLSLRFRDLIKRHKEVERNRRKQSMNELELAAKFEAIGQEARRLIEHVVIRRSRIDLENNLVYADDLHKQNITFPKVIGPSPFKYDLGRLLELYLQTLKAISGNNESELTCARYKPAAYIKNTSDLFDHIKDRFKKSELQLIGDRLRIAQINLADFTRRLLVRRFESSKYAFKTTLKTIIEGNKNMQRMWDEGRIPIMDRRKITRLDEDVPSNLEDGENTDNQDSTLIDDGITDDKNYIYVPSHMLKEEFIADIQQDIELLQKIYDSWFKDPEIENFDPKIEKLVDHLQSLLNQQPDCKIIVFSSYADTIKYLFESLKKRKIKKVMHYTASLATKANHLLLKTNFDASVPKHKQSNNYDILLTTDAVSEGYNLHRAGVIINYDIPYNPTRVIQRIGRINRINDRQFDEIKILNSFPTAIGEAQTNIKQIATMKIQLFNTIIGNDTKTLTVTEKLRSMLDQTSAENIQSDLNQVVDEKLQSLLDVDESKIEAEQESWDTPHKNQYNQALRHTEFMDRIQAIPRSTKILRKNQNQTGIIVFGKKADQPLFALAINGETPQVINEKTALDYLYAQKNEKGYPISNQCMTDYKQVKATIFARHRLPQITGRRRNVLKRLSIMLIKLPDEELYYADLITAIKDFDDISEGSLKDIALVDISNERKAHLELQKVAPSQLIDNIMNRAQRREKDSELILLTEEFRL